MVKLIANWLLHGFALIIVSKILPGIHVANFPAALLAVAVISLVNLLIKPVLVILTLPITILSLGLFIFVINAFLFLLASSLVTGFTIDGFGTAIVGSILFSIISTVLQSFIK